MGDRTENSSLAVNYSALMVEEHGEHAEKTWVHAVDERERERELRWRW